MPCTALDPRTALVVIDLQKGLSGHPTVHPFADVVAHARRLADAFRRASLPVVLVSVEFALTKVFPRLGEVDSTEAILRFVPGADAPRA